MLNSDCPYYNSSGVNNEVKILPKFIKGNCTDKIDYLISVEKITIEYDKIIYEGKFFDFLNKN
jgi:hypothetical protein